MSTNDHFLHVHQDTHIRLITMAEKDPLEAYKISGLPDTMYYIPNFITSAEESHILNSLPSNRWINLSHRRLQAHPSTLSKTNTLLSSPLPPYLVTPVLDKFSALHLFDESPHKQANHVLVNEYNPNEGIMPHEDGAAYHPIVATVSLGANLVLDIYEKRSSDSTGGTSVSAERTGDSRPVPRWRIFQEPRSLLITTGAAYTDLLHGIAEVEADEGLSAETVANWDNLGEASAIVENGGRSQRGTRTSLTYRDVLKVSKVGARILGLKRG